MGEEQDRGAPSLDFRRGLTVMGKRRHSPRAVKALGIYTIDELATVYGVHPNTVRHWLNHGMAKIDDRRPFYIRGSDARAYHEQLGQSRRSPCGPSELYCFKCRSPRRPAGDMADHTATTPANGTVTAICPHCERVMKMKVGRTRLAQLRLEIDVIDRPAFRLFMENT